MVDELPELEPDGFYLPEVGPWSERKYRLVASYAHLFATGMKNKWDRRVFIDLFAAAGRATIAGTPRIIPTSSMLALAVRDPFDRYVMCEIDERCANALQQRVAREHPQADVVVIHGDCNQEVTRIRAELPKATRTNTMLALCLVDPCAVRNLKFSTIRDLSSLLVDFLVLIPSHMDANRNQTRLLRSDYPLLDEFLGGSDWRETWRERGSRGRARSFGTFIVEQFARSMESLGFLSDGPGAEVPVRDRGRLLYYLLYSRSPRGKEFWRKAVRSSDPQLPLL